MPCRGKGFKALWPRFPLSPSDPIFLLPRGVHCHAASRHPFLVLHRTLPKQCFTAHSAASGGGFTFTTIITPQGACQLLCSVVIKTSTLKIQGVFPSVSALLCVGRSLIHGSVLQPSHDRWVGWSEIQDLVTHEIAPAAQGFHSPSQHPKLWPSCCSLRSIPSPQEVQFSLLQLLGQAPCCIMPLTAPPEQGWGLRGEPIHLAPTVRNGKASLLIHPH